MENVMKDEHRYGFIQEVKWFRANAQCLP